MSPLDPGVLIAIELLCISAEVAREGLLGRHDDAVYMCGLRGIDQVQTGSGRWLYSVGATRVKVDVLRNR